MEIETYKVNGCTVSIRYDQDSESPADWGNFKIVTFNRSGYAMDSLSTDEDSDKYYTEDWKPRPWLAAKLRAGKAWPISYSSHGPMCNFALGAHLERPDGLLMFEDDYVEGVSKNERETYATGDLETYTEWANGAVYGYIVTDPDGNELDSLWGIYGFDYAKEEAKAVANRYVNRGRKAGAYHG